MRLGQIAERGKLDSIFFADGLADARTRRNARRRPSNRSPCCRAIAGGHRAVGLIATASTSYNDPYNLARAFASLDHISGGRAGWNIVTSGNSEAALNFGLDSIPEHAGSYRRAQEFLDVVTGLWDSWDQDAVVPIWRRGVFADPAKVRTIDHVGEHFSVRGPLNSPRSPQGRPVLVQAGSSRDGQGVRGDYAEAVFTAQTHARGGQALLPRAQDSHRGAPDVDPTA